MYDQIMVLQPTPPKKGFVGSEEEQVILRCNWNTKRKLLSWKLRKKVCDQQSKKIVRFEEIRIWVSFRTFSFDPEESSYSLKVVTDTSSNFLYFKSL